MDEFKFVNSPVPVSSDLGFTRDQEIAINKIQEWYDDPTSLMFTLAGSAGTGKTYILDYLLRKVIKHSVCVTAPTHKAVKVVERATGRKGRTLQSLHGLRPNTALETFDLTNIQFDPLGNEYIKDYKIVVIDECSQINTALHELNLMRAKQYGTKILYIGDHRQLPPIKSNISPTFQLQDFAILNEVVRQKATSPLLMLLDIAKRDVDTNGSQLKAFLNNPDPATKYNVNDKGEGFVVLDNNNFAREVLNEFNDPKFFSNVDQVRYGAWTNANILIWNNYIRKSIIPDTSKIVSINDLLTGYRTIVNEFGTVVISNSDDYFIESITERLSDDGFKVFVVNIKSISSGIGTVTSIVDHTDASFVRFKGKLHKLYYDAKYATASERSKRWKAYFTFKDKNLILIDLTIPANNGRAGTEVKKDIDYGYGLTIHKLQGSTFHNILVNMRDICYYGGDTSRPVKNYPGNDLAVETRNKLIYTALSRASHKAIILW